MRRVLEYMAGYFFDYIVITVSFVINSVYGFDMNICIVFTVLGFYYYASYVHKNNNNNEI